MARNPQIRFKKNDGSDYPDWASIRLGNVVDMFRGLSYNSENVQSEGLLVLRSNNIQDNRLDLSKNQLQFVNIPCSKDQELQNKDIVICMANGSKNLVGKTAEYNGEYKGSLTVGAFCAIIRPKIDLIKHLFQTNNYRILIDLSLAGTNINNLKASDLIEWEVFLPTDPEEQQKIAEYFTALDNKIANLDSQLSLMKEYKKAMLQRMFV